MLWLAALSLTIWIVLLCLRGNFWRMRAARLPVRSPQSPAPRIAAVIPARDEAGLIAKAVHSLRTQLYPGPLDIFVIDDHSADTTAAEARAAGARVLPADPLPAGWTGKMWAVAQGVERALPLHPGFILLTDADIVHAPGTLAGLVEQAGTGGFDLVSLMVRLHCQSWAERACIPAFVFFFLKLYPPAWISSPRHRVAGAAGGCMLIRAETLRRIGGIAAIRGALIDDCALAAAVKRAGGRVWLGLAGETASVRPYLGAAGIWKMISRTAFRQLRHSALLLLLTTLGMALVYLAPPLLSLAGAGPARWCGLAAWILMTAAYLPAIRFYRLPAWWSLALPAVACFYTAATIDSAVRYWAGAGGAWKGRLQDGR